MSGHRRTVWLVVVALAGAACGGPVAEGASAGVDELVAEVTEEEVGEVAASVNAFGFDLHRELYHGEEQANVVVSPVSVGAALAMLLAGTGGRTATEIAEALHLDDARDVRVGALLGELMDVEDVVLEVANALWADAAPGLEGLQADYRRFVAEAFDAALEEGDLGAQRTADGIDEWVADNTRGLIKEMSDVLGLPDDGAVLVLLNALYFLGEWTTPFPPNSTGPGPFELGDGGTVEVPMMRQSPGEFEHAERDGYQVLRLPYGQQERFGFEVLLPDADSSLDELVEQLDATEWRAALDDLAPREFDQVALPRLELEAELDLIPALVELGIERVFTRRAELAPLLGTEEGPPVTEVAHKTRVEVDEEGTEAAAATGSVTLVSPPENPFSVNRPFAFTISDATTGAILFLGTVDVPRA